MQTQTEVLSEILTSPDFPGQRFERTGERRELRKNEYYVFGRSIIRAGSDSLVQFEILRELPSLTSDIQAIQTQVARVEEAANVPEIVPLPDTQGFAQYSFEKGFECAVGIAKSVKAQYSIDELIEHLERTLSLVKK